MNCSHHLMQTTPCSSLQMLYSIISSCLLAVSSSHCFFPFHTVFWDFLFLTCWFFNATMHCPWAVNNWTEANKVLTTSVNCELSIHWVCPWLFSCPGHEIDPCSYVSWYGIFGGLKCSFLKKMILGYSKVS